MKKTLRIISLLGLSILYCFAIGLYSGNDFNSNSAFSKQTSPINKAYEPVASPYLFYHIAQQSSVTIFHNGLSYPKDSFKEFFTLAQAKKQSLVRAFSQYNFYSQNVIPRLQRWALLFPFHYFW